MRMVMLGLCMAVASCTHLEKQGETIAEHRDEAGDHFENARVEEAKSGQGDVPFEPWDLDDAHTLVADRELIEANAHLAAARSLEAFESRACAGLSAGERASCPLFASRVRRVEWAKDGFTLTFKQASDAAQTYGRLRCHLAYAIATGFDRPSCPLFIPGTSLRHQGADGITFVGDSAEVASALRVQARRVFPASQVTPHRADANP